MRAIAAVALAVLLAATGCATPIDAPPAVFGSASDAPTAPPVPLGHRQASPPAASSDGVEPEPEPEEDLGPVDLSAEAARAGYGVSGRVVGTPGDINVDLATSFPRRDAVFPQVLPRGFFDLKQRLYACTGLQLAFSYQALFQHYSETLPIADLGIPALAPFAGKETGAGGWLLIEAKWDLVDRGGDYQGSLEAALDWRHALFDQVPPLEMKVVSGSGWGTGALYWEWDPSITALFWQQWFGRQTFELRIGKQAAGTVFDFFRFKDARVSGMADPVHADLGTVPAPAPGYGLSFKLWPFKRPSLRSLYVVGTVNDTNGDPTDLSPESLENGQFFYGLEVGYNWKRKFPVDFDHAHLSVWYSDERTDPYDVPSFLPNKSGWGFKVAAEKQCGRVVAYGKYAYNTVEGGGLGLTWAEQTATVGAALVKPLGVKGELALSASWSHPLFDILRDQYGADLYWRILMTPNLWVTPGVQLIWDPAINRSTDFLAVPGVKFRWFF